MYPFIKRSFDLIAAILLFIVISPLFLVLIILVRFYHGSPVFFKQARTTKGEKVFYMRKFRSMTNKRDANGELLSDADRLTKFGSFLRSTSLDELPELLNIIKGDMAVIGPRPLLPQYHALYFPEEMTRFNVRGGLIPPDLDDHNTWDKQLTCEAAYGANLTFKKDMNVFIGVFKILFTRVKSDYGSYHRDSLEVERAERLKKQSYDINR